jgi:hypothetical protein
MIGSPPLAIVRLSGATWFRGEAKKQSVVARSTAEAEYRAMAHGVSEGL